MIPKYLKFKGLYSYKNEVEIDFEKLTSSHIFGIFGPTGSGKSAILDAILYSLYDKIERLNDKDNKYFNMMNLNSNSLSIEFEFEVNNILYKSVISMERNKRDYNKINKPKKMKYKKEDNNWIVLNIDDFSKIIGLSYENFLKTIIIMQGKFQEFLYMTTCDRTKMLKEIFKLEKYDLSQKTNKIFDNDSKRLSAIENELNSLVDVTNEKIEELESQLSQLESENKENQNLINNLRNQDNEQNSLKEKYTKLENNKSELDKKNKLKENFDKLEEEIKLYEKCISFKDLINQKSKLEQAIINLENEKKSYEEGISSKQQDLTIKEDEFKEIKNKYNEKDKIKKEIDELGLILQYKANKKEKEEINKKLKEENGKLKEHETSLEEKRNNLNEIKNKIEEIDKKMPDINVLTNIKIWFNTMSQFNENNKKISDNIEVIKKEIEKLTEDEKNNILSDLKDLVSEEILCDFSNLKENLTKNSEKLSKDLEVLQNEVNKEKINEKLKDFADNLKEGEPCPLCGATSHPNIYNFSSSKEKLVELEKSIKTYKNNIEKINNNIRDLEIFFAKIKEKENQINNLENELKEINDKIIEHNNNFIWNNYDRNNYQIIIDEIKKSEDLKKEKEKYEKEKENIEKNCEIINSEINKLQKDISKLNSEISKIDGIISAFMSQITNLQIDNYEKLEDKEIESKKKEKELYLKDIENKYNNLKNEIESLNKNISELNIKIENSSNNINKFKEDLDNTKKELEERLQKVNLTLEIVTENIGKNINVDEEKAKIKSYFDELNFLESIIKNLENELQGKEYKEEEHKRIKDELQKIEEINSKLSEQIGYLRNEIENMKRNLVRKEILENEKKALSKRVEILEILKKNFTGNGFVEFVSRIFLKNLCKAANVKFKELTNNSLLLNFSEDASITIIDMLNDGKERNIKTLSGGQMFQASLSFALALADSVQSLSTNKQNFFFIDEGFGTLDNESLQIVFNTLRKLKNDNKIVGIISHVKELQEEIGNHIRVSLDKINGSKITPSWL